MNTPTKTFLFFAFIFSNSSFVGAQITLHGGNYLTKTARVICFAVLDEGVTDESYLTSVNKIKKYKYFDGFGWTKEDIAERRTSNGKDLIQFYTYDADHDSLELNVIIDTTEQLYCKINISLMNSKKEPIFICRETSNSEFFCGMSSVFIKLELLIDSCFININPECDPPVTEKNEEYLPFISFDSVRYQFDITDLLERKKDGNVLKLKENVYRFRIFHSYKVRTGQKYYVRTGWFYLIL
jgi:hypothetical protein